MTRWEQARTLDSIVLENDAPGHVDPIRGGMPQNARNRMHALFVFSPLSVRRCLARVSPGVSMKILKILNLIERSLSTPNACDM